MLTTGSKGAYEIDNLGQGTLDLFVDPGSAGVQGGSGVLNIADECRMVNWQVSGTASAVASQGGPSSTRRVR